MPNLKSTELTEAISEDGIAKLKKNQTLTFDYEGSKTTYKITRITKDRIWGKEIRLYHPDEIKITDVEK